MIRRRLLPVALGLAVVVAAGVALMSFVSLRTDLADFLPPGSTPASRFLFQELRSGAAATLILIGIEEAPPEELARISRAMATSMEASGRFAFVANGAQDFEGPEKDLLLKYRYLLSSRTTPEAFTAPRLRQSLEELLRGLASSAGPLLKRFGFADPVGAFFDVVKTWIGSSRIEQRFGVWFAADGGRALMIAKSTAAGLDVEAQRAGLQAIRAAFAGAAPGGARLLVTGPAVFSLEAADAIRADAELVTLLSAALILAFLLWQYRSPIAVAVIAVPLGLSVAVAAAAVQLVYGFVHGITLGFGMTMLGVTVDYPILLLSQRRPDETARRAVQRIWPTMRLAALAAALGLVGMLLSSFPGLSQLGLFSVVGVATAAAITRFLLPPLVDAAGIRAVPPPTRLLERLDRLRVRRALAFLPLGLAALYLVAIGGPRWETDLANLSPVPERQRDLDGELRHQLGAPDVRYLIAVRADDEEGVLERIEAVGAPLADLVEKGAIGGVEDAARYLPSRRTQLARQAALPAREPLEAALHEAMQGLPFRPGAFEPFLDGVAASRTLPPLTRADIASPVIGARIDPFLFRRDEQWYGVVALADVRDPAAVARLVDERHDPSLAYIDIKSETNGVAAAYTEEAARWVGLGGLAVLAALVAFLGPRRAIRVATPILGALLLTLASLALLGVRLTLFHLVSLLLMVGVSLDYALFFNREAGKIEDAARTFRSLVNCNITTLTTFGLLTFCQTPILRGIGSTVALGVLYAIGLAFLFGERAVAAGRAR